MTRQEFGAFCFEENSLTREISGGGNAEGLRILCLLGEMQTGAVLFSHLVYRMNPASKITDLGKFLLDRM